MAQQDLIEGVYDKLVLDQTSGTFYDDLTGRIYETLAPQDATRPMCVFTLITDPPDLAFGKANIIADFQFDVYGDRDSGAKAAVGTINDKLFALMHGATITVDSFSGANVQCTERGIRTVEEDVHRVRSEFRVYASEN